MASFNKHVAKDGKVTWRVRIRREGHGVLTETFPNKRLAEEWANKIEHGIFNARYFPERAESKEDEETYTVGQAVDRYIKQILPQKAKGSQDKQKQILAWWHKGIGDTDLNKLKPSLFEEYKQHLWQEKGFSEYTVNLYLSTISHVFTVASSPTWRWMKENPLRHVKRLREKRDRLPNVSPRQFDEFLFWCEQSQSPYLSLFVRIALSTGGRKREILDLMWHQVDLKHKRITFENTKNKERRAVPIDDKTTELLQGVYRQVFTGENWWYKFPDGEFIFKNPKTGKPLRTLFTSFKKVCIRTGLPKLRIHDLRHIYATNLAEKGKADLGTIADLLGHKNLQQTRRYRHLTEKHASDIVQRMADEVFGHIDVIGPPPEC